MTVALQTPRNTILASLGAVERSTLLAQMTFIPQLPGPIGEARPLPNKQCYFPESGLICHVAFADAYMIETSVLGYDGMFGMPALAGVADPPLQIMVQAETSAWVIGAAQLADAMMTRSIQQSILRFNHCLRVQLQQTAACNTRHHVRERTLRWLLLAHDRMGGAALPLTQEALAIKLGARRQLLSGAVAELVNLGAVNAGRGWIKLADRRRALSLTCKCYGAIANEYERVMGFRGTG